MSFGIAKDLKKIHLQNLKTTKIQTRKTFWHRNFLFRRTWRQSGAFWQTNTADFGGADRWTVAITWRLSVDGFRKQTNWFSRSIFSLVRSFSFDEPKNTEELFWFESSNKNFFRRSGTLLDSLVRFGFTLIVRKPRVQWLTFELHTNRYPLYLTRWSAHRRKH